MERTTYFVDVLLPLPIPDFFTYRVPHDFEGTLDFGIRVVVPFGKNRLYSALVVKKHTTPPRSFSVKYIIDTVDERPIIAKKQFALWQWMADYYMCTLGEVMTAALPSALKLASETKIMLHPAFHGDLSSLTENECKLLENLAYRPVMTINEITKSVGIVKIIPIIKSLIEKEVIITDEEIKNPYKPKIESFVSLTPLYENNEAALLEMLDTLNLSKKTEKQADLLLAFLMAKQKGKKDVPFVIKKNDFLKSSGVSLSSLNTLIKKEVLEIKDKVVSRLIDFDAQQKVENIEFSVEQQKTIEQIKALFEQKSVVLLHGVTGSGKTEIYIKLIEEVLSSGKQVLYLLPEIALTSQIVNRLRYYFGNKVGVYHSRFNEYERVEIWNRILDRSEENFTDHKYQLILGARSALLLPYQNLGLIIVDEEHDGSYKQSDPAPRYQARDTAVMLGQFHQAKVLLGTATPSIESYYNVKNDKYGLVELNQRYAESQLPEIWSVDLQSTTKKKEMTGNFSQFLIDHIREALDKKEQIILFQNRRGYALRLYCNACQNMPICNYCDVTLTYHKKSHLMKCHYCGYAIDIPKQCPLCKSSDIEMKGFGTEKLEEELALLFPDASVSRLDFDTTRSKSSYQKIITDFEQKKTDILVGTQMVTKGLDFDNVSIVGILNADQLLSYPDFRSFEKAYQTLSQVSGRAGRKNTSGKVIIQTYQPKHPILQFVANNDYLSMYLHQIEERKHFHYPPIDRLIRITLKNKNESTVNDAGNTLAPLLRNIFRNRILGPEFPIVSKIQNYYLKDFWLKLPKNENLKENKDKLQQIINQFYRDSNSSSTRIVINVDY